MGLSQAARKQQAASSTSAFATPDAWPLLAVRVTAGLLETDFSRPSASADSDAPRTIGEEAAGGR